MTVSNPTRFLSDGSTDRGLALKMFSGRVLTAARMATKFADMLGQIIAYKNIDSGKSWQWPIIGDDPVPEYHTPGDELLGQIQQFRDITVTIDDFTAAHREVPDDQALISQFDVYGPYADAMGRALAIDLDSKISIMACLGARTAALTGYHYGGTRVTRTGTTQATTYAASATGAGLFRTDVGSLAASMDEKNVPKEGRFLFITPYINRVLSFDNQNTSATGSATLFSRDYADGTGNILNQRIVRVLEGFNVIVTNNMPDGDYSASGTNTYATANTGSANTSTGAVNRATLASPTNPTKYLINASHASGVAASKTGQPAAIALCGAMDGQAGVAMVEAGSIQTKMSDEIRNGTTFMVSRRFFGLGVLCPWMCGEICTSAS